MSNRFVAKSSMNRALHHLGICRVVGVLERCVVLVVGAYWRLRGHPSSGHSERESSVENELDIPSLMRKAPIVDCMREICGEFPQMVDAESQLFEKLLGKGKLTNPKAYFILGAPRTGSTVLYQALCSGLDLPLYFQFNKYAFSTCSDTGSRNSEVVSDRDLFFRAQYGKTEGIFQPSEGSAVMAHWFGGGHPSALVSNTILNGRVEHFLSTLGATEALFGRPIAIKNAWNCFRIRFLAEALPEACFIWIRRDVSAAAKSDLAARIATQGSPTEWNSATPANVDKLRKLPACRVK